MRKNGGLQCLPIIYRWSLSSASASHLLFLIHCIPASGSLYNSWNIPACSCLSSYTLSRGWYFPPNSPDSLPHFIQGAVQVSHSQVGVQDRPFLAWRLGIWEGQQQDQGQQAHPGKAAINPLGCATIQTLDRTWSIHSISAQAYFHSTRTEPGGFSLIAEKIRVWREPTSA